MSRLIHYGNNRKEIKEEELVDFLGEGMSGWASIVIHLVEDLFDMGWDGDLLQIKEKFGGLRFYIGRSTEEMSDRIAQAETESCVTCIKCGETGKRTNTGWILPLCLKHTPASWRSFELLDSNSDTDSAAV